MRPQFHRPTVSFLLLVSGGCAAPGGFVAMDSGAPEGTPSAAQMEPGVALSCELEANRIEDLEVFETDVPTVFRVSWTSEPGDTGWVAWSEEGGRVSNSAPTTNETGFHQAVIRGLHATSDVSIRAVSELDGSLACSELALARTGAFDAALPGSSFTRDEAESVDGYAFVPIITPDATWITVFDGEGEVVWALPYTDGVIWRLRPSRDGTGILFNVPTPDPNAQGRLMRVDYTGHISELLSTQGLHADFVEMENGKMAFLTRVMEVMSWEGAERRILGDALVMANADGELTELWRTFDSYDVDLTQRWEADTSGAPSDFEDWSHANYLSYDQRANAWLVSMAGLASVASIDRATSTPNWTVSVSDPSALAETDQPLINQPHSVNRYDDDEFLVFNRNDAPRGECSEAIRFRLGTVPDSATETWNYSSDDCLSVYFLGEALPIEEGAVQVVFTTSGRLEQVDAEGARAWSIQMELGAGLGFSGFRSTLFPTIF